MLNNLKELYSYREMLKNLVRQDLRTRYKGSMLGFFWTFLNPLLLLIVYTVVFSLIMRVNIENYSMFLFVALLPWIFFSTSVQTGASSLVIYKELLKKVYFPREIIPLSIVVAGLVNFFFSFAILFPSLLLFGIEITGAILYLPLAILPLFFLALGFALITSALNVFFRDLEHMLGIFLMAWFFFTPILYPIEMLPRQYLGYFLMNPVAPIVLAYRDILFYGKIPDLSVIAFSTAIALLLVIFGYNLFLNYQKNFAEEL